METTNNSEIIEIQKFCDDIVTKIDMKDIVKETYKFMDSYAFLIFDGSALVSNDSIQEVVNEVPNPNTAFAEKNDNIVIEI